MARMCVEVQHVSFNYVWYSADLASGRELEECLSGNPVEEFALEGRLNLG